MAKVDSNSFYYAETNLSPYTLWHGITPVTVLLLFLCFGSNIYVVVARNFLRFSPLTALLNKYLWTVYRHVLGTTEKKKLRETMLREYWNVIYSFKIKTLTLFFLCSLTGFLFGMSFVKTVFHLQCNMLQVMLVPWQVMAKTSRIRYVK